MAGGQPGQPGPTMPNGGTGASAPAAWNGGAAPAGPAGQQPQTASADANGQQPLELPSLGMPGLAAPIAPRAPGQPRSGPRGLVSSGGSQGGGESGGAGPSDVMASLGPPGVAGHGPSARRPLAAAPLSHILGNRDWNILIECQADKLTVHSTKQQFSVVSLQRGGNGLVLVESMRQLIARRQATVRPGETPYRAVLRFRVHSDGLRCYYTACSLLDGLRLPMARENVEDDLPGIPNLSRD